MFHIKLVHSDLSRQESAAYFFFEIYALLISIVFECE